MKVEMIKSYMPLTLKCIDIGKVPNDIYWVTLFSSKLVKYSILIVS